MKSVRRRLFIALMLLGCRLAVLPTAIVALECAGEHGSAMPACCKGEHPGEMCPLHHEAAGETCPTGHDRAHPSTHCGLEHQCGTEVSILDTLLGATGDVAPSLVVAVLPEGRGEIFGPLASTIDIVLPPFAPPPRA